MSIDPPSIVTVASLYPVDVIVVSVRCMRNQTVMSTGGGAEITFVPQACLNNELNHVAGLNIPHQPAPAACLTGILRRPLGAL